MNGSQAAPDIGAIVRTGVIVVVVLFAGWLVLAWAVVKRPILAIPVAAFTGLAVLVGMHDAQALAIYLLGALWVWRGAHRASFDRIVGRWVRGPWVRWWVYERRWRNAMLLSGLGSARGCARRSRRSARSRARRGVTGCSCGCCWGSARRTSSAAPELAHSFGASSCRVREDRPGRVWLEFTTKDPLVETVPALPVSEDVDLEAVPIGRQDDGEPWTVAVLGTHMLVAGMTGAG